MPKNQDIKSVSKRLAGKSSHVVFGSSVAAGMKRYVTMIRVAQDQSTAGKSSKVVFTSTAASNTASSTGAASTAMKLRVTIQSALATSPFQKKVVQIPQQPDTENHLFTIAASKWFGAYLGSVAGASSPVNVFAQWYDQ
jgi:hypothetical protein